MSVSSAPLRIAQVSPLYESVPPKLYGGTERVVSYLTEGLVRRGHEVSLFASGDSKTNAKLIACGDRALRLDPLIKEPAAAHACMLDKVLAMQDQFDLIHFHSDFIHFPLLRDLKVAALTTLHGRLDQKEIISLYRRFMGANLVSISNAQRLPLPENNWIDTVYHGLPLDCYAPNYSQGSYYAFLGRVSPEKGLEKAIAIAIASKTQLKIAAKVDSADKEFFETKISPWLDHELIEYIGEIGETQKGKFLGGAKALLFPIDWPEPFGMVMIEAMACATPVLAFRAGSVEEVIDHGVSGLIVSSVEEAMESIKLLNSLSRIKVRAAFERRFGQLCMVDNYLCIYKKILGREPGIKEKPWQWRNPVISTPL